MKGDAEDTLVCTESLNQLSGILASYSVGSDPFFGGVGIAATFLLFGYENDDSLYYDRGIDALVCVLRDVKSNDYLSYPYDILAMGNFIELLNHANIIEFKSSDFFQKFDESILFDRKNINDISTVSGRISLCYYLINKIANKKMSGKKTLFLQIILECLLEITVKLQRKLSSLADHGLNYTSGSVTFIYTVYSLAKYLIEKNIYKGIAGQILIQIDSMSVSGLKIVLNPYELILLSFLQSGVIDKEVVEGIANEANIEQINLKYKINLPELFCIYLFLRNDHKLWAKYREKIRTQLSVFFKFNLEKQTKINNPGILNGLSIFVILFGCSNKKFLNHVSRYAHLYNFHE
ncbi:hypothetical protein [Pedobacter sp. FW305-3-2-15-E-R2A2]|uniref:hypothetical protein n=1 Tax=Pedobacter sp. FW305-3-2-15-E-R2A2 TaxID=3140251 RepID=UPI0031403A94